MGEKLNPPILENVSPAQTDEANIKIAFEMNRAVGWDDFRSMKLSLKSVQTNREIKTATSGGKTKIIKRGNIYYVTFNIGTQLQVGQYYKAQIAYINNEKKVGFYSNATTFKFTKNPILTIQNLNVNTINSHKYTYFGKYTNINDKGEKVYSYQFDIYDRENNLLASSGEKLHNSAMDTSTEESIDSWTTRQNLMPGIEYILTYKVKTINGLECTSPPYIITDGQTVPSNIFKYFNFIAELNQDNAYVELALKPVSNQSHIINGKFVLTRSSSEDNFQSWQEMTRFILASWDSSKDTFSCRDYSVSQGITYKYGLQAYNDKDIYTAREESEFIFVDFEDTFLSDGKRQLRIRFNPKISSFKNTLLESKIDTLGGQYPFFFRNGNIFYKEFPISGMISLLTDENHDFINGIYPDLSTRRTTPAAGDNYQDLLTNLSGENFQKEREFKLQVLDWLTNGKPKLFRSPGEGSYLVRLMNTSLTPNDTLGRMLHSFQCTAYEIADLTFDNLQKYGMLMDNYLETRNLKTFTKSLYTTSNGKLTNLKACRATVKALPGTELYFKLNEDEVKQSLTIGPTGSYTFSNELLEENYLMEIGHLNGLSGLTPEAQLFYSIYEDPEFTSFSYVDSVDIIDQTSQWIGSNRVEIETRFKYPLKESLGLIYYLKLSKKSIVEVDNVTKNADNRTYSFSIGGSSYAPKDTEILKYNDTYYSGETLLKIDGDIDYNFQLREKDKMTILIDDYIIYNNISNVDYLYLGNGLYADLTYQIAKKTYTVETSSHFSKNWDQLTLSSEKRNYYDKLQSLLGDTEGGLII